MSTPAGYALALILFFGRGRGRGGRATAKPTVSRRTSADGFAVKMKQTKAGGRVVKSCSPLSAAKWQRQKSRRPRGKSGDFFAEQKNTTRPLTVWIVGTGIVFSGEMCHIIADKSTNSEIIFVASGFIGGINVSSHFWIAMPIDDFFCCANQLMKKYNVSAYVELIGDELGNRNVYVFQENTPDTFIKYLSREYSATSKPLPCKG